KTTIQASQGSVTCQESLSVDPAAFVAPAAPIAPAAGTPTWDADVFPLLQQASCKDCHLHPKGRFKMTLDEGVDYAFMTTHSYFEPTSPLLSRFVLKATGEIAHGGGAVLAPN